MALSATDLRIGNLVQYTNDERVFVNLIGKTLEVTAADILSIYNDNIPVEPILLTEQWIEKFGFSKHSGGYLSNNETIELTFDFLVWKPNIKRLKILYVHQLQNLYFAITGEELILKNESL
jgi:hypothetical protein